MNFQDTTIVLGGPGSGKTTKLISIVEEALVAGVRPNKVGYFSFTKKAVEEGRDRASARFNIPPEDLPHFRTIHSMAFKQLGMKRDQMLGFQHIRELGKLLGLDFKGRNSESDDDLYGMNSADRLLFLQGLAKNKELPLKKVWEDAFEDSVDWSELERFSTALERFKKNRGLYDFNDLIERFCKLDPRTLPQFEVLIIDESQDNSTLQWRAVRLLGENAKQVYVGGDDCQNLYSWSGADVRQFIELPGKQITLEQSYRVPESVHSLASELTDRIGAKRPRKWLPKPELGKVSWHNDVDEVDLSQGTWMLLSRNGYMLNDLENYCLEQGFSFHSVHRDPLKSPALAAIKSWENLRRGNDEPAERVLDVCRYLAQRFVGNELLKKLKACDAGRTWGMPELLREGLKTSEIWHASLTRIAPVERDYFIAARKRGESLLKTPRISISTIHAAKGGEADHVLLLTDMSARCYQNMENNLDDELKVFYVAATRCKQSLNLISPKTNLNFEF